MGEGLTWQKFSSIFIKCFVESQYCLLECCDTNICTKGSLLAALLKSLLYLKLLSNYVSPFMKHVKVTNYILAFDILGTWTLGDAYKWPIGKLTGSPADLCFWHICLSHFHIKLISLMVYAKATMH